VFITKEIKGKIAEKGRERAKDETGRIPARVGSDSSNGA
jgi:hypothetical protein